MMAIVRYLGAIVTLLLALPAAGAATQAQKLPAVGAPERRPVIRVRTRPASTGNATYTIDDVGTPPAGTYAYSTPVGFNDTGQIFGTALRKVASVPSCLVWSDNANQLPLLEEDFASPNLTQLPTLLADLDEQYGRGARLHVAMCESPRLLSNRRTDR